MTPADWDLADVAVRDLAPRALDALGYREEAARLRALDEITSSRLAGEAVSALSAMLERLREASTREDRRAVVVAEWTLGVAMAAERECHRLVASRAETLARQMNRMFDAAREEAPGR